MADDLLREWAAARGGFAVIEDGSPEDVVGRDTAGRAVVRDDDIEIEGACDGCRRGGGCGGAMVFAASVVVPVAAAAAPSARPGGFRTDAIRPKIPESGRPLGSTPPAGPLMLVLGGRPGLTGRRLGDVFRGSSCEDGSEPAAAGLRSDRERPIPAAAAAADVDMADGCCVVVDSGPEV